MPELPEVETIRVGLDNLLPGRQITSVKSDWPRSFPNAQNDVDKFLVGAKIAGVRRRAKVLLIDLANGCSLVIHLKMTGQLVFRDGQNDFGAGHPTKSLVGKLPDRSTRVVIGFTDASKLFFNDQRKFGWVRLIPTAEIQNFDFFRKVGPEPLAANFTAADFAARLHRRAGSGIKAVLLDQSVVAGIGNIYADESLWGAKIHPETKVKDISPQKLKALYAAMREALNLSIAKGGSTDKNYVDAEGKRGSYLSFAKVFRREGLPCPRCSAIIIKLRVAGRGTHICPTCQTNR
jgi:formamidopyrimidine-DNA glycosylase